jgi:hypothetical protein
MRESTQDAQIQFKEIGGLNQRPAPSNLPYPDFGGLHGLYPPRDGWMQRLEGTRYLAGTAVSILNLFQLDDGTGDVIAQTSDGSEVRFTLNELFGRAAETVSLVSTAGNEEDSMSMALIVHEENQGTDGGSLNAGAGSEALNTFYSQKLTANSVNEGTIITTFRDYLAGANPNTFDLAAGTYRIEGSLVFHMTYGYRQTTMGTFTVTIASPGVFTISAHGLVAGDALTFTTTGALPTGLTAGTAYYVIAAGLTANAFEVSATLGGSAVNTSGTQSGIHTATAVGKTETAVAALYDETNAAVLATFTPSIMSNSYTAVSGNPTFTTGKQMLLSVFGSFTLAGAARLSIKAATNATGGINFASTTTCRGKSHTATTALGGSALKNRYTTLKIIKET